MATMAHDPEPDVLIDPEFVRVSPLPAAARPQASFPVVMMEPELFSVL